jgi:hypothetical protein
MVYVKWLLTLKDWFPSRRSNPWSTEKVASLLQGQAFASKTAATWYFHLFLRNLLNLYQSMCSLGRNRLLWADCPVPAGWSGAEQSLWVRFWVCFHGGKTNIFSQKMSFPCIWLGLQEMKHDAIEGWNHVFSASSLRNRHWLWEKSCLVHATHPPTSWRDFEHVVVRTWMFGSYVGYMLWSLASDTWVIQYLETFPNVDFFFPQFFLFGYGCFCLEYPETSRLLKFGAWSSDTCGMSYLKYVLNSEISFEIHYG